MKELECSFTANGMRSVEEFNAHQNGLVRHLIDAMASIRGWPEWHSRRHRAAVLAQEDAEGRLLDNLDGLRWLVPQLDDQVPAAKPNYRTWREHETR